MARAKAALTIDDACLRGRGVIQNRPTGIGLAGCAIVPSAFDHVGLNQQAAHVGDHSLVADTFQVSLDKLLQRSGVLRHDTA